jgi:hypothetical protein
MFPGWLIPKRSLLGMKLTNHEQQIIRILESLHALDLGAIEDGGVLKTEPKIGERGFV